MLLEGYASLMWSDTVADRTVEVGSAMLQFLAQVGCERVIPAVELASGEGSFAGLNYQIRGHGPPLVLFPLSFALAADENLSDRIRFEQSNGESLAFDDNQFDVAFCCTVMEEGNVDAMLWEMVRVTRPGRRIVFTLFTLQDRMFRSVSAQPVHLGGLNPLRCQP